MRLGSRVGAEARRIVHARVLLYRGAAAAAVCLRLARSVSGESDNLQAARGSAPGSFCRSISTPIAQMKPSSSRPIAVTTCCLHLPRAIRRP